MFGFALSAPGIVTRDRLNAGQPNLLANSWQFDSVFWGGAAANWTVTGGQADVFGNTKATVFTALGAASAWGAEVSTQFQIISDDGPVCYSAYYRAGTPSSAYGSLRLYDHTFSTLHSQAYSVFGDSSIGLASSTNIDGSGIQSVGGGWYRIHLVLDLPNRGTSGDMFSARLELFPSAPTAGQSLYVCGLMLNYGSAPVPYAEAP